MKSKIQFANDKIQEAFNKLEKDDLKLYQVLMRAFNDIENNVAGSKYQRD